MVGLRRLSDYYDRAVQDAVHHLERQYNGRLLDVASDTKWVEIDVQLGGMVVTLQLGLPPTFPDEFPTIKLDSESAARLNIPHLTPQGKLCLFDTELASPNPERMIEVLDVSIERAKQLILDGIAGTNVGDFEDELESYWSRSVNTPAILSLIEVAKVPTEKHWLKFQQNGRDHVLIADSLDEGRRWLQNLGYEYHEAGTCLYLPIDSLGTPPYPTTNKDLFLRLVNHSPASATSLLKYLSRRSRPTLVVAHVNRRDPNLAGTLVAWEHPKVPRIRQGQKKRRSAYEELMREFPHYQIQRFSVTRIDRHRLLVRGGTGDLPKRRCAIVGCGSVGSHVSQALVHMGVASILLVDNDWLVFDNIARHVCGASYVGKPKVEALRHALVQHSPHLDCCTEQADVLNMIRKFPTKLDGYDLVVVAVARYTIERRLSQLVRLGQIRSPLLFVWVEPFVAGGHAFYQPPETPGCFECLFDEKGDFKRQVLKSPSTYLRRESGCTSTYSPYAVLDVQRFVSDLTHFIEAIFKGRISAPALFTWLGDIDTLRSAGIRIHPRWAGAKGYTNRTVVLTEPWLCPECKP